ncbi:MAG: hypothetical protein ACJAUL_002745 [Paraglaciecola sp.]|jgi:hypothetical protein
MKKWLLATLVLPVSLMAEPLVVQYSSFYSHVRKLQDEDTNALQFAFGFKKVQSKDLCHINSAYIHTQKVDIDLTVSAEQRFTVPSEKALKQARAEVILHLQEPANKCDMSVQLETKPDWLKTDYSAPELKKLYTQYQAFFDDMGSFLSFLMPTVQGITVHFSDHQLNYDIDIGDQLKITAGKLDLSQEWIANNQGLTLPVKPLRITAIVDK